MTDTHVCTYRASPEAQPVVFVLRGRSGVGRGG